MKIHKRKQPETRAADRKGKMVVAAGLAVLGFGMIGGLVAAVIRAHRASTDPLGRRGK